MKKHFIAVLLLSAFIGGFNPVFAKEMTCEAHLTNPQKMDKIKLSITLTKNGDQCIKNLKVFNGNSELYRLLENETGWPEPIVECWLTQLHSNGLDQLILETHYMSDGNRLYILNWDGKKLVNVFGNELVQLMDVKDINKDGNKELIVYSRYEGVHIYEFDSKIFKYMKKDEKYPKEMKKLNTPEMKKSLFSLKRKHDFNKSWSPFRE